MQIIDAAILGIVQGVTEFLPVSSSAHLLAAETVFGIDIGSRVGFDAMLHVASAAAVMVFFSADLWILAQAVLRKLGRLPVNERDLTLFTALILAAIPALVLGLLIDSFLPKSVQSIGVVAVCMLMSAVLLMFVEWRYLGKGEHEEHVEVKNGFFIGVFQLLALIPGFSREGAAVAGGMFLGVSRYEATRFSLILAIPVLLGYGIHGFLTYLQSDESIDTSLFLVGGVAAFVTSLITIRFFLNFMKRQTLWPFIWYTVIFAALLGYVSLIA